MSNFADLDDKFIVINRKHIVELDDIRDGNHSEYFDCNIFSLRMQRAIESFVDDYERATGKSLNQKYIVCNQDEPYARQVADIILGKGKPAVSDNELLSVLQKVDGQRLTPQQGLEELKRLIKRTA